MLPEFDLVMDHHTGCGPLVSLGEGDATAKSAYTTHAKYSNNVHWGRILCFATRH